MVTRTQSDEAWVLDLCDAIVRDLLVYQYTFERLYGGASAGTEPLGDEMASSDVALSTDRDREAAKGQMIRAVPSGLTGIVHCGSEFDRQATGPVRADVRTSITRLLLKYGHPAGSWPVVTGFILQNVEPRAEDV